MNNQTLEDKCTAIKAAFEVLANVLPGESTLVTADALKNDIRAMIKDVGYAMDVGMTHIALKRIWLHLQYCNRFFQSAEPWKTVNTDPADAERTMWVAARSLEAISVLIWPYIPQSSDGIRTQLGLPVINPIVGEDLIRGLITDPDREIYHLHPGNPLFMKIDKKST